MILPVSAGIITRLVATYGPEAVAAFGVATRIEMFSLTIIMALNSVISPFVGQNWGAKKYDRVQLGMKYSQLFAIGWGVLVFVLLLLFGKVIATRFNADPLVISAAASYLAIVPIGYGLRGVQQISTTALNVLNKPLQASSVTIIQAFVIYIPCAYVGSRLFGLLGIFSAAAISYIFAGILVYFWLRKYLVFAHPVPAGGSGQHKIST
jgi:Na+-driven multidrug efflux pump